MQIGVRVELSDLHAGMQQAVGTTTSATEQMGAAFQRLSSAAGSINSLTGTAVQLGEVLSKLISDTLIYTDTEKKLAEREADINKQIVQLTEDTARLKLERELENAAGEPGRQLLLLEKQGIASEKLAVRIKQLTDEWTRLGAVQNQTEMVEMSAGDAGSIPVEVMSQAALEAQARIKAIAAEVGVLQQQAVNAAARTDLLNDRWQRARERDHEKAVELQNKVDRIIAAARKDALQGMESDSAQYLARETARFQSAGEERIRLNQEFMRSYDERQRDLHESVTGEIEAVEGQIAAEHAAFVQRQEQIEFLYELGAVSASRREQLVTAAARKEYEAEYELLQRKLQLYRLDPEKNAKESQRIQNEIDALKRQHDAREQLASQQHLLGLARRYDAFVQHINSAFRTAINGVIQGTQTLSQAFSRMGASMVAEFAAAMEKLVMDFIAKEIRMLIFHQAVEKAKTDTAVTAEEERKTVSAAASLKEIMHAAGTAAAKTWSAVAAIPVVGPFLAPAAAAAALAGVLAFEGLASAAGGWERVPEDQLALVHRNEMVLPASLAAGLRNVIQDMSFSSSSLTPGVMLAGAAGPSINVNTSYNHNTMDPRTSRELMEAHGDLIGDIAIRKLKRWMRDNGVRWR